LTNKNMLLTRRYWPRVSERFYID